MLSVRECECAKVDEAAGVEEDLKKAGAVEE